MFTLGLDKRTGLATVLLGFAINAGAQTCYEKSPNFQLQGDDYFAIERQAAPSSSDVDSITQFVKSIKGDWQGEAAITECFGSEKSPESRNHDAEIEGEITGGDKGKLNVDYEIFRPDTKTRRMQRIRLATGESNQTFEVTSSGVIASEKFRLRNANGASRMMERIVEFSDTNSALKLSISHYVNGFLSSHENWTLQE